MQISTSNHIISSAIWIKSAEVNFKKANQIAREKSCDYLLIHIKKLRCKWMSNKTCSVAYLSDSFRILKLSITLSGAFILFLLYRYGLKRTLSFRIVLSPNPPTTAAILVYFTFATFLSINLISTFCTQFQHLHCLGLIDGLPVNEHAEMFTCVLLRLI